MLIGQQQIGNPLPPSFAKEYLDAGANDSTDDVTDLRIERHFVLKHHHTNMNQTTFHVFYMPLPKWSNKQKIKEMAS